MKHIATRILSKTGKAQFLSPLAQSFWICFALIMSLGFSQDMKAQNPDLCGDQEYKLLASDGNSPSTLYELDPLTGSGTAIGPIGFASVGAIEYNNDTGKWYATGRNVGGDRVLISLDPVTGAGTYVGDLDPHPGTGSGGFDLAYCESDELMYINGFYVDCVGIGTVDTDSGSVDVIGATGTCEPGNGMTCLDGIIYLSETNIGGSDAKLYTLDAMTGSGSAPMPLTFDGFPPLIFPRINAMDAHEDGTIYASVNTGGQGSGHTYLATLDPVSGVVTNLGEGPNDMDALAWGITNPCASDCEIQCEDQINVSLDASCEATITPAMGAIRLLGCCNDDYIMEVYDEYGELVLDNLVDLSHRNQMMTFHVTEPCCGNSCWGKLLVEYKLPLQIECPEDVTVSCGALNIIPVPPAVGACAGFEVFLFSETHEQLLCDDEFTGRVTRTYKAVDDFGNEDVCSHTITLERLILDEIVFPENLTVAMGNAISCSDDLFEFDANGFPLPWPMDPMTGSGSGVPIMCDDDVMNGLICPLTGSGTGVPLIPGPFTGPDTNIPTQVGCSATVLYTDIELPEIACIRKIMRTWEVREWWCNGESSQGGIQLIEIIDDKAPVFECPDDFTVSTTENDCASSIILPSIDAFDECGHDAHVRVDFPKGFLNTNGGPAELEVGENIITYLVNDDCYNMSSCQMTVTVRDLLEPVAICDQDVNVNISLGGMVEVFTQTFDDGSWDDCGLESIEIRRMDSLCVAADTLFGSSVSFCCTDVGQEVMVVMKVTDKGGNMNQCMIRVHVADKIPPSMTCPPDMTIDCRDAFDINNLGVSFGLPVVNDNCAETQIVEEIPTLDVNQCNIGDITRQFELRDPSGVPYQTCFQHIFIQNLTPFVEANIQWPLNYQVVGGCGIDDLHPNNLPDNFNFPVYLAGDDECSLLGYDYQDEIFEGSPGGLECVLIERTWTVLNWCSQIDGRIEKWTIPQPQILELINDVAPEIDDQGDLVFESGNVDCLSGDIMIKRTAVDDCNNPLIWSYVLNDEDNNFVEAGDTCVVEGNFLVGTYTIEWAVLDGCGNRDVDTQNFTVRNTKAPSPICMSGLQVYLEADPQNQVEEVVVHTSFVDGGSYHTCNNDIALSMSSDTTIKSIVFDCDSIGLQTYRLYVTDVITGAQDFCEATIMVIDSNSVEICPSVFNMVDVGGEIFTEAFEKIEEVEVGLGIPDIYDMTDGEGIYAFNNMPMGGSYVIEPNKDTEYLNGVSTLDLIFMQRHILGLERLDSPYKLIAADADNSQDITAIDLIELRKLILGVYQELPENTSWRFVDALYQFQDPQNPWLNAFPEDYEIQSLSTDMKIDFVGIKIGDVNSSVVANQNLNSSEVESRSNGALTFNTVNETDVDGFVKIHFYGDNYSGFSGWQSTIDINPNDIEIIGVDRGALNITLDRNFNVASQNQGWITGSYHNDEVQIIDEDEILFTLTAKVKQKSIDTRNNLVAMSSRVTKNEAYRGLSEIVPVNITTQDLNTIVSIESVHPNPWVESTKIEFVAGPQENLEWMFYDVNGKLIYSEKGISVGGIQTLDINRKKINTSGVVYVRLISDSSIADYKMVLLK